MPGASSRVTLDAGRTPGSSLRVPRPTFRVPTLLEPHIPVDILVQQIGRLVPAGAVEVLGAVGTHPDEVVRLDLVPIAGQQVEPLALQHVQPVLHDVRLDVGEVVAGPEAEDVDVHIECQVVDRQEVLPVAPLGVWPVAFEVVTASDDSEGGIRIGRIGIGPKNDPGTMRRYQSEVRHGPLEAVGVAIGKTWEASRFTLEMMWKMVRGQLSIKNLSGPLTIADYAGQSAQMGWLPYVSFVALVSISLGVLNLLPVPLLDGGHLMYYAVEIFKGSPVSERTLEIGQRIGMFLLMILMAFAIYNDIQRLFGGS